MQIKKVGFLHPGEMGTALMATALNSKQDAYWCSSDRSQASRDRVEQLNKEQLNNNSKNQIREISTLKEFCINCDIIISVCPPHAAYTQALAVIDTGFDGIYSDVNAISPETAKNIDSVMNVAGIDFVDGGIIGLPPTQRNSTWLYLAGEKATNIAQCFHQGPMETSILSSEPGQASALKMCFAANSKGVTAMLTAILSAAEYYGVRTALEKQWDIYDPKQAQNGKNRIQSVARKAWRFTGEMEEIAATLEAAGMPSGFHLAAAEIYSRQVDFKSTLETPELKSIIQSCLINSPDKQANNESS